MNIMNTLDGRDTTLERLSIPGKQPIAVGDLHVAAGASDPEMISLVQKVFLANEGSRLRKVVFCNVGNGDDDRTACEQAAHALAFATGKSVCLVDGNVIFSSLINVSSPMEEDTSFAHANPHVVLDTQSSVSGVWVVKPTFLRGGDGLRGNLHSLQNRFAALLNRFDYVLINAPNISQHGNAFTIAHLAEAAILVVRSQKTRRIQVRQAKEAIDAAGLLLLGTILTNRAFPIPEWLYGRL